MRVFDAILALVTTLGSTRAAWQVEFHMDSGAALIGHYFWGDVTQECFMVGECDDMRNWDFVQWSSLPDGDYVTFYGDAACQGDFIMGGTTPDVKRHFDENGNLYQGSLAYPISSFMVVGSSLDATRGVNKICEERGVLAASANATLDEALVLSVTLQNSSSANSL